MKINVNNFIPEWADEITGEFPSMFLFCNEKGIIIEADVGSCSVRESELLNYCDKNPYSPEYLSEFSEKPIKEGATNIISGYYDTIEKEFIFFKKYDFKPNENGMLSIEFVKELKVFNKDTKAPAVDTQYALTAHISASGGPIASLGRNPP